MAEKKRGAPSPTRIAGTRWKKESRRLSRQKGIDRVMVKHKLDDPCPHRAPGLAKWADGDHFIGASSGAVSGYPNVTVPAGYSFEPHRCFLHRPEPGRHTDPNRLCL